MHKIDRFEQALFIILVTDVVLNYTFLHTLRLFHLTHSYDALYVFARKPTNSFIFNPFNSSFISQLLIFARKAKSKRSWSLSISSYKSFVWIEYTNDSVFLNAFFFFQMNHCEVWERRNDTGGSVKMVAFLAWWKVTFNIK